MQQNLHKMKLRFNELRHLQKIDLWLMKIHEKKSRFWGGILKGKFKAFKNNFLVLYNP